MGLMDSVKSWFSGAVIKRYVGSVARKVIIALATLLATQVPFLADVAQLIIENAGQYADVIAGALAGLSVAWGVKEKKDNS